MYGFLDPLGRADLSAAICRYVISRYTACWFVACLQVLGMIGFFGTGWSGLQLLVLERGELSSLSFSGGKF